MGLSRAPLLIVTAYFMGCALASAEDRCPAGPFETDVGKIAAAIAAQPLKPGLWDPSGPASGTPESERLIDGAVWTSAGGLGSHSSVSLDYDAKRYLLVHVLEDWPARDESVAYLKPSRHQPAKPIPNQVIRQVGDVTYTRTTARPTPEQAREFACLANRLLTPSPEQELPKQESSLERAPTSSVGRLNRWPLSEITITVTGRRICSPGEFTDAHVEGFELLIGGSEVSRSSHLPCDTQRDLREHMGEVISEPIDEVLERGEGRWRPPHVDSLVLDTADNLYLLIDSGSRRRRTIDVRKVTRSGDVTHLSANTSELFYEGAFAVDGERHVHVAVAERRGNVIYVVGQASDADCPERNRPLTASDPQWRDVHIDSIASAPDNTLYALSGLEILKITPTGSALPLADSNISHRPEPAWYSGQPSHLAVASDGTVFVSDLTGNIILKVIPSGVVTILAGTPNKKGTADGPGNKALFSSPKGLAVDREGVLYVADSGNQTIRRITRDGEVSTLAGKPGKRGTVDGRGKAARFDAPTSIAVDSTGTLYVTSGRDNRIRKVSRDGVVSTLDAQPFIDTH